MCLVACWCVSALKRELKCYLCECACFGAYVHVCTRARTREEERAGLRTSKSKCPLKCVHVLVCGCGCVSLSLSQYVCVCVFVIVCACACLPLASEYPPTVYLLQHALRKTHSLTRAQERLVTFIILTHAHTYAHTQALSMRVKLLNHQQKL